MLLLSVFVVSRPGSPLCHAGRATSRAKFESSFSAGGGQVTMVNKGSNVVPVVACIEASWVRQLHRIVRGALIGERPVRVAVI